MCGIAGLVSPTPLPSDASRRAAAMGDTLVHRGPDESGLRSDPHAVLAHRRLSIVDLASGQQPLSNEDGSIWVSYNGEIYNHADLRKELEQRGHRYRTRSDTETIVHAYEEWGDDCVRRFRGMFAFAIWDAPRRRMLLVRDRLGIKPLYWARADDLLLFASEIKGLLASGLIEARPNTARLPELLSTRYVSGVETLFHGVQKLLPGHRLVFEGGAVRIDQYWNVPSREHDDTPLTPQRTAAFVARFRELLEESIRCRLMSDVPLGVFLSGGIDSSAIAALMAPMVSSPLQTFSVAFRDREFNELEHARTVAAAFGTVPHEVLVDDRAFFGALPRLVWHEDEPIAHPSSVPLYFVSNLARKHVTVVLTGEGSDELLAGYGKYLRIAWNWRAGTLYERVPRAIRKTVASQVVPRLPGRLGRLAQRSFLAMARTPEAMCFDNFAAIRLADQQKLLARPLRSHAIASEAYGSSTAHFNETGAASTLLDRLLYTDMKTYLVELLMKQDQMSMAASIESRVPFLDHLLVEFSARLPDAMKLDGWTTKRVLREAVRGLLPEVIVKRPKMGFPVPIAQWTRGDWNGVVRDVLLDRRTRERGIVDPPAVEALLRAHAAGQTDGADRLWSLLNLELWYRTFIDKQGIQTLPVPPVPEASVGSRRATPLEAA